MKKKNKTAGNHRDENDESTDLLHPTAYVEERGGDSSHWLTPGTLVALVAVRHSTLDPGILPSSAAEGAPPASAGHSGSHDLAVDQRYSVLLVVSSETWGPVSALIDTWCDGDIRRQQPPADSLASIAQAQHSARPRCDLAIVDKALVQEKGFAWLAALRRSDPEMTVLLLTQGEEVSDGQEIATLLQHRISGSLPVEVPSAVYLKAILCVLAGELWFPRAALGRAVWLLLEAGGYSPSGGDGGPGACLTGSPLTRRERAVIDLLRQGLTNKEISRRLRISSETVKKHLHNIFAKAGVHRRGQLMARAAGRNNSPKSSATGPN